MNLVIESGLAQTTNEIQELKPYSTPEKLISTLQDGVTTVDVNADVASPAYKDYSIGVLKNTAFTQEQADKIWLTLLGDTPMYAPLTYS